MMSEKGQFDVCAEDDNVYKSCFARSMAVNSQFRQVKCKNPVQLQQNGDFKPDDGFKRDDFKSDSVQRPAGVERYYNTGGIRMGSQVHLIENSSRRSSLCSTRITEIPVENFFLQSQMETLQWQLKQTEASREMYRAVMKQIVVFLERAHRSLEIIGSRLNGQQTVPRSRSEHQMNLPSTEEFNENESPLADSTHIDSPWRKPKKQQPHVDEVSPEKLSQEAFRLLRTAQSLLSTREPNLANVNPESTDELEFMAQLAKEFPSIEPRPQRTTSFSLSPKLLVPEHRIASAVFNRKLSLPLSSTDQRRSLLKESFKLSKSPESNRNSIAESDLVLNDADFNKECRMSDKSVNGGKYKCGKHRQEPEKSSSPPMGSISSAEDESGFSSMNSFQEVGLPLVNSTACEEITSKEALLRSMLNNGNTDTNYTANNNDKCHSIDDVKLWQKPDSYIYHKRRNSSPADTSKEKTSLKVLWV